MRQLCLIILSFLVPAWTMMAEDLGVTEVVAAHEAFTEDPSKDARRALLDALEAFDGAPTVQTVNAYLALLMSDTSGNTYANIRETSVAATAHLEPVKSILPKQYIEAKYVAAIAYFNSRQHRDAMVEMAHVEGFTRAFADETGEQPEWARDLKWKADAWGMAMGAYFSSTGERQPSASEIEEILASYGVNEAEALRNAMRSVNESGLPQCPGKMIQRPKMRYPAGKAMRGMFGAVILGLEFDADGKVVNPKVLASVPIEEFDDRSLQVVGKWRYKPDNPDAVGVSCRLERTDVVQPLVFQIR